MKFWSNTVFLTILHTKFRCRSAPNLNAVFLITRFTFFRLQAIPIKRNRCQIKILFKFLAVYFVVFWIIKFVKHKYVCTETEIMSFLIHFKF